MNLGSQFSETFTIGLKDENSFKKVNPGDEYCSRCKKVFVKTALKKRFVIQSALPIKSERCRVCSNLLYMVLRKNKRTGRIVLVHHASSYPLKWLESRGIKH